MANKLPYMLSPGLIPKIFEKIHNARRPERFTQDFLETKLSHSGGSARAIIPLLKRLNFLGSDGVPTRLYDQLRNPETQAGAVAEGMRIAFKEIFDRNEYAYDLSREKLTNLIVEITGSAKDERTTQAVASTFLAMRDLADFEFDQSDNTHRDNGPEIATNGISSYNQRPVNSDEPDNVELRIGYTINLNLPETTDPDVFNAIFKSLKENLLKN
ncbi:DUF5343 domain-containing protein [Aurantimonas coralicida]|uniref:DUF5343 domain-containing protein n=1 Tax=Aurantimonas coralicida TaxID=182270 RepID=UPI0035142EEB